MNTIALPHRPSRSSLGIAAFGVVAASSVAALALSVGSFSGAPEAPSAPAPVAPLTSGPDWSEWEVRCMRAPTKLAQTPDFCARPTPPAAAGGRPGAVR